MKEGDKVNYIGVNLLLKAKEFESSFYFFAGEQMQVSKE